MGDNLHFILFNFLSSSHSTTLASKSTALSEYKYIVFSNENDGDAELADIIMIVQNELAGKLTTVSQTKAQLLVAQGEKVLSPKISVKSEKWDGGMTYISIIFHDFDTNLSIAVIKSSGIGLSIEHDQDLALKAIKKEINKAFKSL